ncbi:MAG TPA: hypothetical protein DDY22_11895 [Geobacter sp.]|nr:hypothetical protein [Geobacter sp.]
MGTGVLTVGTALPTGKYPFQVAVDPSGRFAYLPISSTNRVTVYTVNQLTGALTEGSAVPAGLDPRSAAVDPSGRFVYVANYASNNVSVFNINQSTGALTGGATVAAGSQPISVTVDPSGKFAYVANNGSGDVSVYSINQITGALTAGTTMAAGTNPFSIAVAPTTTIIPSVVLGAPTGVAAAAGSSQATVSFAAAAAPSPALQSAVASLPPVSRVTPTSSRPHRRRRPSQSPCRKIPCRSRYPDPEADRSTARLPAYPVPLGYVRQTSATKRRSRFRRRHRATPCLPAGGGLLRNGELQRNHECGKVCQRDLQQSSQSEDRHHRI